MQVPLVIVQVKIFAPPPKLVTVVFSKVVFVIVPCPVTNAQAPLPIVGELAAIVTFTLLIQIVWSAPALAVLGNGSTVIFTWSDDDGHVPLVIVHWKIFTPTVKPVTADVGEVGLIGVPVPETNVHIPLPIIGVFPENTDVVEQTV